MTSLLYPTDFVLPSIAEQIATITEMNARIAAATDLHNRHASEIWDRVRTMEQLASDALVAVTQASHLEHIDNRAARAVPIASS